MKNIEIIIQRSPTAKYIITETRFFWRSSGLTMLGALTFIMGAKLILGMSKGGAMWEITHMLIAK